MPTALHILIITQKLQKGKKNFQKWGVGEMTTNELIELIKLFEQLPSEKQKEFYNIIKGAALATENQLEKVR